jgi:hypothetical protein
LHADNEFECIREDVRPILLDIVPANSHVGEIKRSIRTIKERLLCCVHGLPYKRIPKLLLTHMAIDAVRCLNIFPWELGLSQTLSPTSIMTGLPSPDYNNLRSGRMYKCSRTIIPQIPSPSLGAIALTPTGNAQGDFFLSLATGARISRHH